MNVRDIERLPEVEEAGKVLAELEVRGIAEAAIASGWTRSFLTDSTTTDIDVSYVGDIHFEEAQVILASVLDDLDVDSPEMWDIKGIWNAQIAYGVPHTVDNFLLYYVNSIDSVYLGSDGKLHDPTGHGFNDAKNRVLRMNMYDIDNRTTTGHEEVNVCLEGCRRMAKLGWDPTGETSARINAGVHRWSTLSEEDKRYFTRKLAKKYVLSEVAHAQIVYEEFGWGFIFSEDDFTGKVKS